MRLGLGLGIDKSRVLSSGAYTPSQDNELFDWWDAQANVTETSGELSAWVGAVNSETANPPTVTSRPLYGTDSINGLDVLTLRSADPNYVEISVNSLGSTSCIHYVIKQTNSSPCIMGDGSNSSKYIRSRTPDANTADVSELFGGSIEYYKNGVSLGVNITREDLYTAIFNQSCVLSFKNIDLSTSTSLLFSTRATISLSLDGLIADIIISSNSGNFSENAQFLINKYGF